MSIKHKSPNFLVIGAPKSGTTSLYYYLKNNPHVFLPDRKELHYFSYEELSKNIYGPGDELRINNLVSTYSDYLQYFKNVTDQIAIGEVSPSYLYYTSTSKKILKTLGRIKIIILLRNPIHKAYSQYMHMVRENREKLSFWEALQKEQSRINCNWGDIWRYAESSLYAKRVKKYIDTFGSDNVKIIIFEDFISNTEKIYIDTLNFLGVNTLTKFNKFHAYNRTGTPKSKSIANFFSKPNIVKSISKYFIPDKYRMKLRLLIIDRNTGKKRKIDNRSLSYLTKYFAQDIITLEKLINIKTNWIKP